MKKYSFIIIFVIVLFASALLLIFRSEIKPIDSLMHPPSNSDSESSIKLALENETGKNIVLKTPERAKTDGAVFYEDLNGNGKDEAIVFYTKGKIYEAVDLAVFEQKDNNWNMLARIEGTYSDVIKAAFADINDDGKTEIIVGFSTYNSDITRKMFVYSLNGKNDEYTLDEIYSCSYSAFAVSDINFDGVDDIFVIGSETGKNLSENTAYFVCGDKNGLSVKDSVGLDASISSVVSVSEDYLKSEKAVRFFIDGYTSDGFIATDVILCGKNSERFEKYDFYSAVQMSKRNVSIFCTDVNGDGVLEIPATVPYENGKQLYSDSSVHFIEWRSLEKEGVETIGKMLENQSKGFYLIIDDEIDEICYAVADESGAQISFYSKGVDSDELLFEIIAVNNENPGDVSSDYKILTEEREYDYYYRIHDFGKKAGISKTDIMNMIVFETEGSFA